MARWGRRTKPISRCSSLGLLLSLMRSRSVNPMTTCVHVIRCMVACLMKEIDFCMSIRRWVPGIRAWNLDDLFPELVWRSLRVRASSR